MRAANQDRTRKCIPESAAEKLRAFFYREDDDDDDDEVEEVVMLRWLYTIVLYAKFFRFQEIDERLSFSPFLFVI